VRNAWSHTVSLALAQLRYHRWRWALLAAGVALVVAVPVVSAGLATSVSAQTIRRTIARLDIGERTLLVSLEADSSLRQGTPHENDVAIRHQLGRLTGGPVRREMLFRKLTVQGVEFFLGATDKLAGGVHVASGQLPRSCTPTRCEVVLVGGAESARLAAAVRSLGVVVVGRAERTDPLLASGPLDPGGVPLLLGDGVDTMTRLSALALFGRHYNWATTIDAGRVVSLGVAAYTARGADVDDTLSRNVGGTSLNRPDQLLQAADQRASASTRRFGLLGGFAAVLLLGFAVVAAVGLRRESGLLVLLVRRRGATRAQVWLLIVVECAVACVAGAVIGCAIGSAVSISLAGGTGLSAASAVGSALAGAGVSAALLTLATTLVTSAVLLWPDAQASAVWHLLDLVAFGCLAAAVLAADRGSTSASDLAAGGDPLVVTLPVLASVTAGLLAARLWGPAARFAERLLPRRSLAGRIGLLGAIRRPLRPTATTAFLTAAVASVVFAGAYRATLLASDADQAAYQVPLDATLGASSAVPAPSSVVDASALQRGMPGSHVVGVLRTTASVSQLDGVSASVPVLAVDRAGLSQMNRWTRTTGSSASPGELAGRLDAALPERDPTIPAGTTSLTIAATGADPQTTLSLWLRGPDGREILLSLRQNHGRLEAAIPSGASGPFAVVAIGVEESADYATHHAHAVGEGNNDQPLLSGRLTLAAVTANGAGVGWDWSSWGSALGTVSASGTQLSLGYRLAGAPVIAVPQFAARRGVQLRVAVDPATAKQTRGNQLQMKLDGSVAITANIVAVLPRLPTVEGAFVLADRATLGAVLDLVRPGRNPTEYWVAAGSSGQTALARALAAPPYSTLTITRREHIRADLDSDPVGRGSRTLLVLVGLLALGVAAVALVLLVLGERRDGAGELFAWEADGVRPRVLRRMLVIRTAAVAAVAVPLGVLAGSLLARVGTTLVAVDASGSTPTPPLEATIGSVWTPLTLLAGIGAGLLVAGVVALRSLRERYPVPAEADLR